MDPLGLTDTTGTIRIPLLLPGIESNSSGDDSSSSPGYASLERGRSGRSVERPARSSRIGVDDGCPSDKPCPPCSPYPAGSVGYQGPKVSQQGVDKGMPHYILFEVQQIPSTCQCIWKENTKGLAGGHHSYDAPEGIDLNGLQRPPPYPGR
ncbi:MAG: hypothetical protein WC782_00145 [Methylococcaceae bacterium]|jgi:hypothetical protein